MNVFLVILFILIVAVIIFVIYRRTKVNRQNSELNQKRLDRVKPILTKLENKEELSGDEIFQYSKNLLTRVYIYDLLKEYNRVELFPKEFSTLEKASESFLANWLEFPTELGICPDEIELVKKVTIDFDNNDVYYYVFKFRTNAPHWASNLGWIQGVVGPYFTDSIPYHKPGATFSRIGNELNNITAEEEAKWVHENISMRRF